MARRSQAASCRDKFRKGRGGVEVVMRITFRYAMFDAFDSRSGFRTCIG